MNLRPVLALNFYRNATSPVIVRKYNTEKEIEKTVIISESNDIYTNLALEDWYYKNSKFERKHMLILWSNNPCVVIGKFQNPWLEADVSNLGRLIPGGIHLARRNSGGGTVYHDRGNLNLTFFTPRDHYNRKHNLEIITRAVLKEYGLKIDITKRDDLVIGDCKVSGTAAKLARTVAYHHCTLLVNSDKKTLSASLKKPDFDIQTVATQSTKSKIINISEVNKDITVENLMVSIGKEYLLTTPYSGKETVENKKPYGYSTETGDNITKFRILRPTEEEFPGLTEIRDTLISWEWKFGKCPKFRACKPYSFSPGKETERNYDIKITFTVEEGRIKDTEIDQDVKSDINVELEEYKDRKFTQELFDEVFGCICEQIKIKYIRKNI